MNYPKELEEKVANNWLSTGAITITDMGDENTYYINEFGSEYYCKNYPTFEQLREFYCAVPFPANQRYL